MCRSRRQRTFFSSRYDTYNIYLVQITKDENLLCKRFWIICKREACKVKAEKQHEQTDLMICFQFKSQTYNFIALVCCFFFILKCITFIKIKKLFIF